MSIKTWFPTSIYYQSLLPAARQKHFNRELRSEIYAIRDIDEEGQKWSSKNYFGGFTSYASMSNLHLSSPNFGQLKTLIDKHVQKFARHLDMDLREHPLKMNSCWVNIMPTKTSHSLHIHPLSVISGTYYVETPARSGAIKFEDPRLSRFMNAPPKKENCREANKMFVPYAPQAGKLILFESWLGHEVPPNPSRKDRVSISFNYG